MMDDGKKSTEVPLTSMAKLPKTVLQPKKNLTSFMYFNMEYGPLVRKANPTVHNISDIMKVVSQKWNELNLNDKSKYDTLAKQDKLRYDNQVNELLTNGFFIMENGSKSSDFEVIPKKKRSLNASQAGKKSPEKKAKK